MKEVGIRELKDRLSEYMRRVQAGETLVVTDRGRPVARIVSAGVPDGIARLMADRRLSWSGATVTLAARVVPVKAGRPLSDYISEDRD